MCKIILPVSQVTERSDASEGHNSQQKLKFFKRVYLCTRGYVGVFEFFPCIVSYDTFHLLQILQNMKITSFFIVCNLLLNHFVDVFVFIIL